MGSAVVRPREEESYEREYEYPRQRMIGMHEVCGVCRSARRGTSSPTGMDWQLSSVTSTHATWPVPILAFHECVKVSQHSVAIEVYMHEFAPRLASQPASPGCARASLRCLVSGRI